MYTERGPCQHESAPAGDSHEGNSLHVREADQDVEMVSTHRPTGLTKEFPVSEETLGILGRTDQGSCDRFAPRKSTRISQGGRILRNHRYRRMFDESRHTKRLFTPEIKKYLKDWLIRRRDHPYPNRDEKKSLANQTGLTYIQICNWFANWRRKLKNAGSRDQRTWSHLIKSYNTQAEGNVEHFSICSDDSIWDGKELADSGDLDDLYSDGEEAIIPGEPAVPSAMDHCYSVLYHGIKSMVCTSGATTFTSKTPAAPLAASAEAAAQCFTVSSTTTEEEGTRVIRRQCHSSRARSSRKNMETRAKKRAALLKNLMVKNGKIDTLSAQEVETSKTLSLMKRKHSEAPMTRAKSSRVQPVEPREGAPKLKTEFPPFKEPSLGNPNLFRRWMQSATNYQPTYVPWSKPTPKKIAMMPPKKTAKPKRPGPPPPPPPVDKAYWAAQGHQQEELDAAEALTCLAGSR